MEALTGFTKEVQERLGYYVYCLCAESETERTVFYVGKGQNNRVFEHEAKNFSDFTDKGIALKKYLEEGRKIGKYILDYGIESSGDSGEKAALFAESALMNFARLTGCDLKNTKPGEGKLDHPASVEEIQKMLSGNEITLSVFEPSDRVLIVKAEKSPHSEAEAAQVIRQRRITMRNTWTIKPLYICVVHNLVFRYLFRISGEIETGENGTRALRITEIAPSGKYAEYTGCKFQDPNLPAYLEGLKRYQYPLFLGPEKHELIRLIRPDASHREAALAFRQEFFDHGESVINGSELLDHTEDYDEWLQSVTANTVRETVNPQWVLTDTFFAVDEWGKLVGIIDLRHELNDFLRDFGNCGYSVRPTERRKGYASEMLRLLLQTARDAGMTELHLSVERSNAPSVKTILRNGGVPERSFEFEGSPADIYKITL